MMSAPASTLPDVEENEADPSRKETKLSGVNAQESTKSPAPKLTEEQVLAKAKEIVSRLFNIEDYSVDSCAADLLFLRKRASYSSDNERRVRYFDCLAGLKVASLFEKMWKRHFSDFASNPCENQLWKNLVCIMVVMWNGTDRSKKLCESVAEDKIYVSVINWLRDPALSPEKSGGKCEGYAIRGFFGVIHNTLAAYDARHLFREAGVVGALKPFLQSPNLMIRTKTVINLAFVITEDEQHLINADVENFALLTRILESCLKSSEHHSRKFGFWAKEVLEVFNHLAAVDSNKDKIVETGVLPLYAQLLEPERPTDNSEEEQILATKGLWTLAFKISTRQKITEMPELMAKLRRLSSGETGADAVKQAARGALWILEEKDEQQRALSAGKPQSRKSKKAERKDDKHVMISYNWGSKPTMLKVRDRLKEKGFSVWMDVDNMTGSTLEAMAQAIEKASIVIVCMTQKYKESPSCRTEAEYTYKLRKPFIPLRLEFKYNPDGWLGIMIGTTLWFDFSRDEKFETSFEGLIKEIHVKASRQSEQASVPQTAASTTSMPPTPPPPNPAARQPSRSEASGWSRDRVQQWLRDNALSDVSQRFADFTGADMTELKSLFHSAPEFYFASLRDNVKLSLLQTLRFTKALKEL